MRAEAAERLTIVDRSTLLDRGRRVPQHPATASPHTLRAQRIVTDIPHSTYFDPRPDTKIGRVRLALMHLLDRHRADGALPTSVRFLFYELVMQRIVTKDANRPDKIVSAALTDLRESGLVPWDDIVDETREVSDYTGSPTVADDLARYLDHAVIDPWRGQSPVHSHREPVAGRRAARTVF